MDGERRVLMYLGEKNRGVVEESERGKGKGGLKVKSEKCEVPCTRRSGSEPGRRRRRPIA